MFVVRYILSCLLTTFWGITGLVLSLFSNRLAIRYAVRPWGITMLWAWNVKLSVEGLENLSRKRAIIMYNHQSSFDILAFSAALPIEWKAIMKKELLHMPFLGWVAKASGHYFVARDGSSQDTREVRNIVSQIRNGPSVILAPEGTRSKDGRLLPFKKGGFLIAMLSGVPVVPMVIWGGMHVRKKGEFKVESDKTITVKVLEPIEVSKLPRGREGREMLERKVKTVMEDVIDQRLRAENRI